ncbi:membrane fusion protein, multidrug efflux system [Filomicrobium insigne]|uniref:Membrane fusion protein, multidrug efflux system n=1 Tax=Filomicrobium insigne TaxID=418854 RepID=A0A1H0L428_9HYPH|nr:efflux RND transporter periplasmic adaptor subunit [Filomicrobium insigne]SDO63024.1 membrane fusion protein, multidrug efflux system [Filomicrobium insigne]
MRKFWLWSTALLIAGGAAYVAVSQNIVKVPPEIWAAIKAETKDSEAKAASATGAIRSAITVESGQSRTISRTRDLRAIGTLRSDESVKIAPEIAGRVVTVGFAEGQAVKQGDILMKLDDALAQAELADAEARYVLAQANNERAKALSKTGNVTEKAQDEAKANLRTSGAAVDLMKVRLDKHTVRAPFDGIVGIRQVSPGAFITAGTTVVNLEKIDQLKVDFSLPEIYLAEISTGQTVDLRVDALPGRGFQGKIYAIDPMVDVNGRSLTIRALVPNGDGELRPGLFVRIIVKGRIERQVVVVPESAVVPRAGENYVYRIDDGKVVEAKVKLGDRANAEVQILEGLASGATVVTAGQQKVKNGASVKVVETRGSIPLQPKTTLRQGS